MKMKINLKNIITFLLVIVGIWIILHLKMCHGKDPIEYWQDPNFKTDTIVIKEPYAVKGDSFPYKVAPKIVYRYLPSIDNGYKVKCSSDSLLSIIDSLGKQITSINKKYLTLFTEANKLIYGKFRSDSIRFDFLKTDGNIFSEIYLTNYQKFEYEYRENQFRAKELPEPLLPTNLPKQKINQSLYASGGYEVFGKTPTISLDYYLRYKKFQLTVEPMVFLKSNPSLMLNTKLGIKLK